MSYTPEEKIRKIKESGSYEELIGKGILPNVHNENYYFVSYSHKDYKFVLKDIIELEEQGLNIWYDSGMRAGENWMDVAKQYLSKFQCKGVIFYLSKNSLTSSACSTEIEYVAATDKKLFSINLPLADGKICSGQEMAKKLKEQGLPVTDKTLKLAKKVFSDNHLYLPYSATIEQKTAACKENLIGEDLFEYRFNANLNGVEVVACRDSSILNLTIPDKIPSEKISNPEDLAERNNQYNMIDEFLFDTIDEFLFDTIDELPVLKICDNVFMNFHNLEKATLPRKLKCMGHSVFQNCRNLNKINLHELKSLTTIPDHTFDNCNSLDNVHLSDNIKIIGESAFANCTKLKKISFGKLDKVSKLAFENCYSLHSITIPYDIGEIADEAFKNCYKLVEINNLSDLIMRKDNDWMIGGLTKYSLVIKASEDYSKLSYKNNFVILDLDNKKILIDYIGNESILTIPSCITEINDYAFYNNHNLTKVTIPDSVTKIGCHAFERSVRLKNVSLGKNLESLGAHAFAYCFNLTEIAIPSSLKTINEYTFMKCSKLERIDFGNSLRYIKNGAFVNCHSLIKVVIPDSVIEIDDFAFEDCTKIKELLLGNSLKRIGWYAFSGNSALVKLVIPNSVTEISHFAFNNCHNLLEVYNLSALDIHRRTKSHGYVAYYALVVYPSLDCPSQITTDENGFTTFTLGPNTTLLKYEGDKNELVIPDDVTDICKQAFCDCPNVRSLTLGKSLRRIHDEVLYSLPSLQKIINNSDLRFDAQNFYDEVEIITPKKEDNISKTYTDAFGVEYEIQIYNCYRLVKCNNSNLTEYTIPAKINGMRVSDINVYAFRDCKELSRIEIPGSIISINVSAFENCSNLKTLTIGDGLQYIHSHAFANCTGLEELLLPDSVCFVRPTAFKNCTSLRKVTIGSGMENIWGSNFDAGCPPFDGCTNLETIINYSNLVLDKEYLGISENVKIINVDGEDE